MDEMIPKLRTSELPVKEYTHVSLIVPPVLPTAIPIPTLYQRKPAFGYCTQCRIEGNGHVLHSWLIPHIYWRRCQQCKERH
jgi:hypothetical protein